MPLPARTRGSNLGQAIFHRPASSGVYALVCHLELGRIGYNDISQTYAMDEKHRAARARALIQSVMHTFLELNGAMRTTQLPHLVALEGTVTWSSSGAVPAPMVSPLAGGRDDLMAYRTQAQRDRPGTQWFCANKLWTHTISPVSVGSRASMRQFVDGATPQPAPTR